MPSTQDIPTSDLLDPKKLDLDDRPVIIHSIAWLTGLATVAVILRLWSRRVARQKIAMDDWLVLGALAFEYSVFIVQMIMTVNGIGRSTLAVVMMPDALQHLDIITKCAFTLIPLVSTALACMKLSVLALYSRIFPTRLIRYGVYFIGLLVVMWWIASVLVGVFGCSPISKGWSLGRSCIQQHPPFMTGNTITPFVMDIAILVLPVHDILKLKMSLWQKLAVGGLFSLGSVSAVAGWVRWAIIDSYYNDPNMDDLHAFGISSIFILLEIAAGIMGVSLTTIRPLVVSLLKHFGSSSSLETTIHRQQIHASIVTIGGSGQPNKFSQSSPQKEDSSTMEYASSVPLDSLGASSGSL